MLVNKSNMSSPSEQTPEEPKLTFKDVFTQLDVTSRNLLEEGFQVLHLYRKKERMEPDCEADENKVQDLCSTIRNQLNEMKSMATDISTIQIQQNLSPRVVDQGKMYLQAVESVQVSLRKLQMEFQQVYNSKQKEDLLSLSRSPFEEGVRPRRRGIGAADISSGATDSLIHSRQLLMETVQRSAGTLEQLAQSSHAILNNDEELKEQKTVVGATKKLLAKYGRREWTDKVLICLALAFFFACVAYILQKRIF